MPTTLSVTEHLEGLREALVSFVRYADRAGLRAGVPTTPDWNVRNLIAHQGMVHRWAAGNLRGLSSDPEALEREGQTSIDPVEWLRDGAIDFVTALTQAPETVGAPVFLHDAPGPRQFWARRQCHETTIHAVDAMAAALGRAPSGEETWIGPALALDGIDELVRGFLPRPKSTLRSDEPVTIAVRPDEGERAWLVSVSPEPAVTEEVSVADTRCAAADIQLTGGAVSLYLQLWNRAAAHAVPELWRERSRIVW
ncbi:maleylpyruvate isomerase family mycothiol-dependent enzyme [Nocardioides cavernaquae]|uniref:Maleylpyruvate isomerase family mycothiol-dependent enzyme n=1 Tax=Nocardioides cavernaquae TaxID=2321396 RepID=A0A3A5H573_9ACTN|nr:maleylpyruvate isomerase family mycothiol-dependent enzyme [Nocardioides cavernaquae]RJS45839.1 maleylpyruvate isomerase family mycothiol-dependent enzyme [Nocardioides cavernaquae]